MLAVDTSVLVAAFAEWHEQYVAARHALMRQPVVAAHSALEAFSVLTRLPPPLSAPPAVVAEYLDRLLPAEQRVGLDIDAQRGIVSTLSDLRISRGAVYDGLIAITVASVGATILTLDRRAMQTYTKAGVAAELIS